MEIKFLTKEELEQLQKLQNRYSEIHIELGRLVTQELLLQNQIDALKQEQENLKQDFKSNKERETILAQELNTKYGTGNINTDTGEFTPL